MSISQMLMPIKYFWSNCKIYFKFFSKDKIYIYIYIIYLFIYLVYKMNGCQLILS